MFLKNCWYVAAWPSELADMTLVVRRILDQPLLLYRTSAGEPVAFLDRCPHRLAPLSAGIRIGDAIRCGYHGLEFSPDGRCRRIPCQDEIPATLRATTFPVAERHGLVWVWMGERALADGDLIPHLPWAAIDAWAAAPGYTHVTADYRLLSDNLLDLSHENYIHQATIGNEAEETIAAYPVQVSVAEGRVVRAHREMANIAPPPMFAMMAQSDARIDRWQTALWTAPGINLTDVGTHPVGTSPADAFRARVLHLLTPETATSTHYFWAHCRSFRLADQELTASIIAAHRRTFDEDKEMLELQQRELDATGATVPKVALKVDDAPLRARRMLNKLVRQEEEGGGVVLAKVQHLVADQEVLENAS